MRLNDKKENKAHHKPVVEKYTIIVQELLDASSSMAERDYNKKSPQTRYGMNKYNVAQEGINQKISELKKDKNAEYLFGVHEFGGNNFIDTIPLKPISEVGEFKGKGPGGMTPLYKAITLVINSIVKSKKPEDRVLLSIYTDGEENNSHGYRAKDLLELIDKVKRENNFTITFVGTEGDVKDIITDLGISKGNTMAYDGTAAGMKMSMRSNIGSTFAFAEEVKERGITSTEEFYSKSVDNQ